MIFRRNYYFISFLLGAVVCAVLIPAGNYSVAWQSFLSFAGYGILTYFLLSYRPNTKKYPKTFLALSAAPVFVFSVLFVAGKINQLHLPAFIIHYPGIAAGVIIYFFAHTTKSIFISASLLFAGIYSFYGNKLWQYKCNYGNYYPDVNEAVKPGIPLSFFAADSSVIDQNKLKGKIVLMDFWATGCGVCSKQFPAVQRLFENFQADPAVSFLSVNIPNESESPGKAFEWMGQQNYTFPVVIPAHKDFVRELGVRHPMTIIIDRNNRIVFRGDIRDAGTKMIELRTGTNYASY
ncbi:MAG TPA: TlpA disulfide reductase family protein [Bacteroidia bacterium]|nr:TlpA disulfide reductase family protein [Bacteroidia bacterium]